MHNQDHALKSPSAIPRQVTPGVICCQADSSLRPARGQWWRRWESNPRPFECHSNALPIELQPHICLLQVRLRILYRVSIPGIVRTICSFPPILSQLVPTAGLEPARLSTLHSECSMSAYSITRTCLAEGRIFYRSSLQPALGTSLWLSGTNAYDRPSWWG